LYARFTIFIISNIFAVICVKVPRDTLKGGSGVSSPAWRPGSPRRNPR